MLVTAHIQRIYEKISEIEIDSEGISEEQLKNKILKDTDSNFELVSEFADVISDYNYNYNI